MVPHQQTLFAKLESGLLRDMTSNLVLYNDHAYDILISYQRNEKIKKLMQTFNFYLSSSCFVIMSVNKIIRFYSIHKLLKICNKTSERSQMCYKN